ncbi:MAG TPA: MFS transporter, partial [Chloroflexota bacterium]|nr:MFS transporter [Chloroflexota bacterium]
MRARARTSAVEGEGTLSIEAAATLDPAGLPSPPAAGAARLPVPGLIRRNTLLLTGAEAFVGTAQQMVPTLGALMVMHLTGSAVLAGIGGSILGLSRAIVSYPSGRLADLYGRKGVLIAGLLISVAGALALGASMIGGSFPGFLLGLLIFGIGTGTSQQQRRLSAADLYPPERRAQGLGIVLTGSLVGAIGGPILISVAGALAHGNGTNQIALSWFLAPIALLPSLALILLIRPDPREIGRNLQGYWPGYRAPEASAKPRARVTLLAFARDYPHV